jgi:membrane-bound lytic murein transglycosylase D
VDSTKAAVRYLKTLHGMFAGDWRLAVMAYNAGEYRCSGACAQRAGRAQRRPENLPGLSGITAPMCASCMRLSCLLEQADDRETGCRRWIARYPVLQCLPRRWRAASIAGPGDRARSGMLRRLNPAFADGASSRADLPARAGTHRAAWVRRDLHSDASMASRRRTFPRTAPARRPPRSHTVSRGESAWHRSARYKLDMADLLARNGLTRAAGCGRHGPEARPPPASSPRRPSRAH